jgi:hypothetical protein
VSFEAQSFRGNRKVTFLSKGRGNAIGFPHVVMRALHAIIAFRSRDKRSTVQLPA